MNPNPSRVELAARAMRDLRRIDGRERRRIRQALDELASGTANADIKALAGAAPWLRLRAGDWRVLYRPLTETEAVQGGPGFLVARVVNRRDLLRAVRTLDT
jgi:mRNA-degrading endonuclease RelE of RelBE toxin-antitoxin system